MHTIIAAYIAIATILPPPWNAPTATPTPPLVWSMTPVAPVTTGEPKPTPRLGEPPRVVVVWLPMTMR
jgi:hypothetical protein